MFKRQSRGGIERKFITSILWVGVIPMALAQGVSYFSTEALSLHTLTNAALLQQWLEVDIHITGSQDHSGTAEVHGMGFSR